MIEMAVWCTGVYILVSATTLHICYCGGDGIGSERHVYASVRSTGSDIG